MSDENEEHNHNHPGVFAFQLGPTPEQIEQARMAGETNGHESREFFDSLNERQLRKLSGLLNHIVNTEGTAGVFYIGLISAFIDIKFGSCMACGKNHDDELAKMSGQKIPDPDIIAPLNVDHDPGFPAKGTPEYDRLMVAYNTEQDDDGSDRVMCKGCGLWYINLQDRALRRKDACHGCIEKAKWG